MDFTMIIVTALAVLGVVQLPILVVVLYSWRVQQRLWKPREDTLRALTVALLAVKDQRGAAEVHAAAIEAERGGERVTGEEEFDDEILA